MPCDIAISEETRDQWRRELADARREAREERREQAEIQGRLEARNAELNRLHEALADRAIQIRELERQNATLGEEAKRRARREKVAWGSAAAVTAAGVILFLVFR